MQFCMAVLISLAGLQAPSVLVKPPLIEVTVLISFRESCLIPDAPYQCFPVYYLTLFSLYSVPVFFFIVTPLAFQKEKEIKLELRLVSEGWLQENMLHTFSDSKANAHILKL